MIPTSETAPSRTVLWGTVMAGILAISWASILIRLTPAPSLTIAVYRVGLAALLLLPQLLRSLSQSSPPTSRQILWMVLSGLFLALHFAFWIESLQKTRVATSVTLVSTTPLFTAIFSILLLKERGRPLLWFGIAACILGTAIVAGFDLRADKDSLHGDLLALLGALMATGYFLTGRHLRKTLPLLYYIFGTYATAGLFLWLLAVIVNAPLSGFSQRTYLLLVLLAVVPQLIGHSCFNWALRHLSATAVAILTLGEPIGATALAFLVLGEGVSLETACGLLLLFTGILLGSLSSTSPTVSEPSPPN